MKRGKSELPAGIGSRFSLPQIHGTQFVQVDERGLPVELGIEKIEANGAKDPLRVQHLENAALAETIRGFRRAQSRLGFPKQTLFEGGQLGSSHFVPLISAAHGRQ
jgi:hypothetical protein